MLFVLIFTSGLLLVVAFCSLRRPHVLWRRVRPEAKIIFRSHSHTICESLSIFLVSFWRKEKKKEMLFCCSRSLYHVLFYDIYWENSSMVAALRIEKGGGNQIQENLISLLQFDQFLLHRVNFFNWLCTPSLYVAYFFSNAYRTQHFHNFKCELKMIGLG